jgi:hypothetical protein
VHGQTHPLTTAGIWRPAAAHSRLAVSQEGASECAWYMVVFTVDTTVGVAVALYLHTLVTVWAKRLAASPVAFPLPLIHTACVAPSSVSRHVRTRMVKGCVRRRTIADSIGIHASCVSTRSCVSGPPDWSRISTVSMTKVTMKTRAGV